MKGKVTKPFKGTPDGQALPVEFAEGDEIVGGLAQTAVAQGWAKTVRDDASAAPAKKAPAKSAGGKKGKG